MNYDVLIYHLKGMYLEEERRMRGLRDWRKALRTPATYRVGNTVRIQPQFTLILIVVGIFLLLLFYCNWWTVKQLTPPHKWTNLVRKYNNTYPLTEPIKLGNIWSFKIAVVADKDTKSKSRSKKHTFESLLRRGTLVYNSDNNVAQFKWDNQDVTLSSTYGNKGRGMELSELTVYDGRLLTFDDRSGVIFEIIGTKVIPWVILGDGDGHAEKGFKAEWATIKDEILYVGSMGKEWTSPLGEFENYDPMWIKAVNIHGQVQHLNWVQQYKDLRSSIGIKWPGYMLHESAAWSDHHKKWFFLPRRCSHESYNETKDEVMGCNYMITADEDFRNIQALEITKQKPKFGFSSFKFIPGTKDTAIVAIKTVEFDGRTSTYISAFNIDGTILLVDTLIDADIKYEGLEFV